MLEGAGGDFASVKTPAQTGRQFPALEGEVLNAQTKARWGIEDRELAAEFAPESEAWRASSKSLAPAVKKAVERNIRSHARLAKGARVRDNWFFSQAPQLLLAALILFSVALAFVGFKEERTRAPVDSTSYVRVQWEGNRWVLLESEGASESERQRAIQIARGLTTAQGDGIYIVTLPAGSVRKLDE